MTKDPHDNAGDRTLSAARSRSARREPVAARPFEYVVVLAINPDMREWYPDSPLSLDEALRAGKREPEPPPTPDLKAEL